MAFQISRIGIGNRFAEGEVADVRGLAGVGFHRLAIDLKFIVDPHPAPSPKVTRLVADVTGPGNQMLGRAHPDPNHLPLSAYDFVHEQRVTMTFDLDRRRLEAIEDIRNGGDFQLNLFIYSTLEDTSGNLNQQQLQASTTVNQGVWVRVLEQLGFSRTLLLELEVPSSAGDPGLAAAVVQLQKAQNALIQGEYRDAVGACRDVLEEVSKAVGDDRVQLGGKPVRELDKAERLVQLRQALKNVTHPARHRDEVAANIDWVRRDAISIVTMTAAVITGLAAPGARPSPPPPPQAAEPAAQQDAP
ncbi:MAG: hypothetical protein JF888_15630 [Candidatus Dormibacteraeota bacterium]|uniref:Uncharacterized protein n=1 Tax=Candidatus Dormiibacter inghamiae TaxID=3127013 RepID=A0A934KA28_9BACT|nr:hypothetical protein [Candidatus Dormibacteraeota bacterium]MBJ7607795.1 hypothetical protein [Candidatus Dormibacteraeota bacterium]